jgi:hypothetical protein
VLARWSASFDGAGTLLKLHCGVRFIGPSDLVDAITQVFDCFTTDMHTCVAC